MAEFFYLDFIWAKYIPYTFNIEGPVDLSSGCISAWMNLNGQKTTI